MEVLQACASLAVGLTALVGAIKANNDPRLCGTSSVRVVSCLGNFRWANFVAFPLPANENHEGRVFQWARHGHTVFEQGSLPALASLPAEFLIGVLSGDMLFRSDTLQASFMRPAIFHAFSGNKAQWAKPLKVLAGQGMVPLMETLLGTESMPPLWQVHGRFLLAHAPRTRNPDQCSEPCPEGFVDA